MKNKITLSLILLIPFALLAQNGASNNPVPSWVDSLFRPIPFFLLVVAIVLFFSIAALAAAIKYLAVYKKKSASQNSLVFLALFPLNWFTGPAADQSIIILLISVIIVELIFILIMVNLIKSIIADEVVQVENNESGVFSINWNKWDKLFNQSVPIAQEAEVMTDHSYDGIRELDNSLPPWWKGLFYFTIVFGFAYLLIYHVFRSQPLQSAEYRNELAEAELSKKANSKSSGTNFDENQVAMLTDAGLISAGKGIYDGNCASCHGNVGQGGVGPNLTDEFWIHGGGIQNIYNTIKNGVTEKGMIAWKSQLSPTAMQKVSSYIMTLQNTNPAGGKAPQGEKWVEKTETPAPAEGDTSATKI